jgi:lauroyl/myristoyl acyltransferase
VRDLKVGMDEAMPARFLHWDPESPSSLREAYRLLRRGELLVVHADGSRGSSFVEVPFFGARLALPTGPARMARKTGAYLLPIFCVARRDGRCDVIIEDPVPADLPDEEAMARCAALLESHCRKHPEQWWTWDRLEMEELPEGGLRLGASGAQTARELFVGRAES